MAGLERKIRKNRNRVAYYIARDKCPNCREDMLKPFPGNKGYECVNCGKQYVRKEK